MREWRGRTIALSTVLFLACVPTAVRAQVGSLIVTITAPTSGSTVSGVVEVDASVTGNLQINNVRFQLDGVNLGGMDNTAPYSVSWDTTTASSGSHTLIAVARSNQGLTFRSSPVTVTVNPPPPDTTPPTVGITSPASGQTVQGTVTVAANASDNVGVAGVRFMLDGANLGPEDRTAPYSVSWNTATAADGQHTLTAVARDAAGNSATSSPVTVTVSNAAPPPPPPSTRFEETSPSVTYTSGWTQGDTLRSWSGGTAAVSSSTGAVATFSFTGPSVSWIGARGPQTGVARVSLDGVVVRDVDTFSHSEEIRVPIFEAVDLANTSHTLTILVTGTQNALSTGPLIVVDAFDVHAVTITRLQETDPDVSYTSIWSQGDTSRNWSAGVAALTTIAGAQASLTFTGTGITWIGGKGPQTGIANVFLDGTQVASVDTFSPIEQIQQAVYTAAGLSNSRHTIMVQVTGTQNPSSTSPEVIVDAFEVTTIGVRHQEYDPGVAYSAGWALDNQDKAYSEGIAAESNVTGAQATITFTGTGIAWIGARGPQTGICNVLLDGAVVAANLDTFAPTEGPQHTDYSVSGLARGTHTLTIQIVGKNPLSTNAWILVDAYDVIP